MSAKLKKRIERLEKALIAQIGDNRICPSCGQSFIPVDATQREAINAFELKRNLDDFSEKYISKTNR